MDGTVAAPPTEIAFSFRRQWREREREERMHLNRAPDQNRHRIRKVERAWTAVYGLTRDANEAAESVNQSALSVRPSLLAAENTIRNRVTFRQTCPADQNYSSERLGDSPKPLMRVSRTIW